VGSSLGPRSLLERLRRLLSDAGSLPRSIALLAAVLALPSLATGLGADDHHFRMVLQGFPGLEELALDPFDIFTFADGDPRRNALAIERGSLPWWAAPDLRLSFWRPLAAATHWLDRQLAPDNTFLVHFHGVLWYAVLGFAVATLYRRFLLPPWVAGLAALLYVVDDARLMSVAWAATRNTVMSSSACVLVLLAHDRWRRDGWRPGAFLAPLAFVAGLLCAEASIGVLGYLVAYALFLDGGPLKNRALRLAPYALSALAWATARSGLGHGVEGSGLYVDPLVSPRLFLDIAAEHLPLLLLDQFAGLNPALSFLLPDGWVLPYILAGIAFLLVVAWAVLPILRRDVLLRFWAVGLLLAAIPASAVVAQNRVLFLVGLGATAVIARGIQAWLERPPWLFEGRHWTTPIGLLAPAALVAHLVLAPLFGLAAAAWMAAYDNSLRRIEQGIPRNPGIAEQDVTIVALPTDILLHGIPYRRSSLRWPSPLRLRALYAGMGEVEIGRPDERTLVLDAASTFLSRPWTMVFRDSRADPFAPGDVVRLSGLAIEVLETDGRGRPWRVRFRFDEPLETATDHWLTWSSGRLVPFELPPVGGSARIPRIPIVFLMWRTAAEFFRSGAWKRAYALDTGPLEVLR